jgi:hypothetical protein
MAVIFVCWTGWSNRSAWMHTYSGLLHRSFSFRVNLFCAVAACLFLNTLFSFYTIFNLHRTSLLERRLWHSFYLTDWIYSFPPYSVPFQSWTRKSTSQAPPKHPVHPTSRSQHIWSELVPSAGLNWDSHLFPLEPQSQSWAVKPCLSSITGKHLHSSMSGSPFGRWILISGHQPRFYPVAVLLHSRIWFTLLLPCFLRLVFLHPYTLTFSSVWEHVDIY